MRGRGTDCRADQGASRKEVRKEDDDAGRALMTRPRTPSEKTNRCPYARTDPCPFTS